MGGATPFLTEKDLVRQVASNITKEMAATTTNNGTSEKAVIDSKRVMAEQMGKVQKVWQAFVKFVKN